VHEAVLRLADGGDERAPGGAVTVALCGHWDHEGPCRWPHHGALRPSGATRTLRVVFAAPLEEEDGVRGRIERALRGDPGWSVLRSGPAEPAEDERELAGSLAGEP
jgi:hypothetical protein